METKCVFCKYNLLNLADVNPMPNTTIVNYRVAGNLPTNQTLRGSWYNRCFLHLG